MRENSVLRGAWLAVAQLACSFRSGVRIALFRVNTGKAWVSGGGKPHRLQDGSVIVPNGRPVALGFGMPNGDPLIGTADLNGWVSVIVTPAMVGQRIAIFAAIETKESGGGHKRDGQINYVQQVQEAGGIAGFANTPDVAQSIVRDYLNARLIE